MKLVKEWSVNIKCQKIRSISVFWKKKRLESLEGEWPLCCVCFLWPLALNECPWNSSSATELSCAPCWLVLCALRTENENANAWFVCQASTATLPGWAAQCTCGIETASPRGTVLLTLTPLLCWGGSSCSSWNRKHPVCCFSDAQEEGGKTPCAQLLTNNQDVALLVVDVPGLNVPAELGIQGGDRKSL